MLLASNTNNGMLTHIGFTIKEFDVSTICTLPTYHRTLPFEIIVISISTNPITAIYWILSCRANSLCRNTFATTKA